ncbi:DAK2 domain-containing protein [Mangrovibrevibacter kandeliae]|uniref:DAK2 domain-containing protein n=1 Tax=Mangrovibrevibacter kandeliae TaxID=2968473 RepID=UPI002117A1EE|nr:MULTISPECIES: DAK2 domain-containing protein [unclassified Aurantimonas]MCQ8783106.1 dihydroxyacetone kinase subunit L [Aurantimonas sp. CSK15Z-1]MCW4115704.1 dihydroxyacetone kinase subunit L [Aurantimonas sp. MSK8Z-1]
MAADSFDTAALGVALQRVAQGAEAAAAELNAADGALGDGDLGITVSRGFAEAAAAALPEDVGLALLECAKAFQRVSSSSYGTLVATGFMAAAKLAKGRSAVPADEVAALVAAARDAMMARGKGALGDKTVLDSLDRVVEGLKGAAPERMQEAAVAAARDTLVAFKGQPCRLGRARMFAEKSAALDDPGQLAFLRILESLAAGS